MLSHIEGLADADAIVTELGDSSITIQLLGWVDQSDSNFGTIRSNAMQNVKAQFDKFNIDMPEPIYKIRIEGNTPVATQDHTPNESRREASPVLDHADEMARGEIRPATPRFTACRRRRPVRKAKRTCSVKMRQRNKNFYSGVLMYNDVHS